MRSAFAAALLVAACAADPACASTVVASIYWPGDGVVPKDDYRTSSGVRYDAKAMTCAHRDLPFGTKLYLQRGHNAVETTITDRGPFVDGRSLDCTPAVGQSLHLDGLGSVRVSPWPPLPRPRPEIKE